MRLAVLVALALLPSASAHHSVAHVVVPGGELVDLVLRTAHNETDVGPLGNWSAILPYDVSCETHVMMTGHYMLGVPVPEGVEEAYVECSVDDTVAVTPDVGPYV